MIGETPSSPGWVYILSNPSMPGLVKIGLTTRPVTERSDELSAPTGVPTSFEIEWQRAVSDCNFVENAAHRMLDDCRVPGKRHSGRRAEFFRCDVKRARQVVDASAGAMRGPRYWLLIFKWLLTKRSRPARRKWRRRGNLEALILTGAIVAFLFMLALFKPSLPGWLPPSVANGFYLVERFG